MKKASLASTVAQQMAEKDKFVSGLEPPATAPPGGSTTTAEKTKRGKMVQPKGRTESPDRLIVKASCYLPEELWLRYKAFELKMAQQRKKTSLNGLIVELLEEKLKNE